MRPQDNSVMKADTNPDVFRSEINQPRDELSDLNEVMSTERLTTININLDALPAEKYSTIKLEAIKDLHQSFGKVLS